MGDTPASLEDGGWRAAGPSACGKKHYDPDGLYTAPTLETELQHRGTPLAYEGSILASFGTDLIEVHLDPVRHERPLQVTFRSAGAQFSVQL